MLPPRPTMPTAEDQDRVIHTMTRISILEECWDQVAQDYAAQHVGEDRLSRWGPMDTSANPLADISRQISTPGLYGVRPVIKHIDPAAQPLIDPDGLLDQAGVFTRLQHVQYMTTGAGDYFLRPHADAEGVSVRSVSPANVYQEADLVRPERPRFLAELRVRMVPRPGMEPKVGWAWDVYDLRGEQPSFSIRAAKDETHPSMGEDITAGVLSLADATEAQAYPWRWADGRPYIPFVQYRAADSGSSWNAYLRRGTHRGTLNAAMYASFMGRSALDASGNTVVMIGVEMPAGNITNGNGPPNASNRSLPIEPGAMCFFAPMDGFAGQPGVYPVGPGANLPALQSFVAEYTSRLAAQYGLTGADIQRASGDASSGFALFVSERGKRLVQKQLTPLYLRSDRELLAMVANMATAAGLGMFPESGYSITYQEIEASPQERAETRSEIEWQVGQGYMSPVEAYQRLNPGTSREQAIASLLQAKRDAAMLEAAAEMEPEPAAEDAEDDDTDAELEAMAEEMASEEPDMEAARESARAIRARRAARAT